MNQQQQRTKVNGDASAHAAAAAQANAKRAERKREQAKAHTEYEHNYNEPEHKPEHEHKFWHNTINVEDIDVLLDLINQPRPKAEIKGWLLFKGYTAKVAIAILAEYMPQTKKSERVQSLRDKLWAHCSTTIMSDDDFNSLMSTGTPNEVKHRTVFNNERMMFNKIHLLNKYKS